MRLALVATIALSLASTAFGHGGGPYRGPPGEVPPPATSRAAPPVALPGDPCHRCSGLRGLAGEVPPDSGREDPPPPPPPWLDPSDREEWPLDRRVVDEQGRPLPNAMLWSGGQCLAASDTKGRLRTDPGERAIPLVLVAKERVPLRVFWNGKKLTRDGDLRLEKGHEVRVHVAHADGTIPERGRFRLVPDVERVPEWFAQVATYHELWAWHPGGDLGFSGLPQQQYRLLLTLPGLAEETIARGLLPDSDRQRIVLPARLGARERVLRVRLLDEDGARIETPAVELRFAGGGRTRGESVEDGIVTVRGHGAGAVTVVATRAFAGCLEEAGPTACAHDIDDDVESLTLRLRPAPSLRTLLVARPPTATEGSLVRVIDRRRGTSSNTMWVGEEPLRVPGFDDAVHALVVVPGWSGRGSVGSAVVGIAPGESVALPPPPAATWTLRGTVVRADRTPVALARVRARNAFDTPDTDLFVEATTDLDGRFEVSGVCGPVVLDVRAPGLSNANRPRPVDVDERDVEVAVEEERPR